MFKKLALIIEEKANETKHPYVEFEEKIIGYSHATVGGYIAKAWNLPEDLVDAISYHHTPTLSQNHGGLADAIHIANGLASILGIGGGSDSFLNPIQQDPLDRLNVDRLVIERILNDIGECLLDPTLFS